MRICQCVFDTDTLPEGPCPENAIGTLHDGTPACEGHAGYVEKNLFETVTRWPSGGNWRVGRKVPVNVYEGDRVVCQCQTARDAARIVAAMNLET